MQRNQLSAFLAGFLTGVIALGAVLALTPTAPAEAQPSAYPDEQIQIMREMSWSLKGIEQALRENCP